MAYETPSEARTVVLDFGAGWRQLLNAQGLEGRIFQVWPNAVRPLRWNPSKSGNIDRDAVARLCRHLWLDCPRAPPEAGTVTLRQVYIHPASGR
jgi:hypothetical protein